MLIHVYRGYSFVQRQVAVLRVLHALAEPCFSHSPGQNHPHGALEEALEIDHEIVTRIPQLADESQESGKRAGDAARTQVLQPGFSTGHQNAVNGRMADDEIGGRFFHEPGDLRLGKVSAQRPERRERMDDISYGAGFDDQDVHWSDQTP